MVIFEPVLARVFRGFVERGFVRLTSGGADVGSYLVQHPDIDTVHITGSRPSHDAIVFGAGEAGERRRAARTPLLDKPVTSELGGVGPVVLVPEDWDDATLRLQARHVATQRLHNSGFNCVATQIVVLPDRWPQVDRFLDYLRNELRAAEPRRAYYPGSAQRQQSAVRDHRDAETYGGDPDAPRTLLPGLDADDADEPAYTQEYFGPVLGVTRIPGETTAAYLNAAVEFCNQRLAGDLSAGLLISPATRKSLGGAFDDALTRLHYGALAVNCWVGTVYAIPRATWGAFPGHDVSDVGSGIGIVHNALLLDPEHVERSVGSGPFRPWPLPAWFLGNRTALRLAGA